MSAVQEIEQAIGALSPQEQGELYEWMDGQYTPAVDAKMSRDLAGGVMDERISQALADREAGNTRAL